MYGILFGSQMHWIVAEYLVIFFLVPMNVTKKFVVDTCFQKIIHIHFFRNISFWFLLLTVLP